jgi:hypothetical protein
MAIEIKGRRMTMANTPPPVGRIFNIGAGSGNLTIDGSDDSKEWYPLQPYDTFKIAGGDYGSIALKDISVNSGEVFFTNQNTLIEVDIMSIVGDVAKRITLDFHNKISGVKYGLILGTSEYSGDKFIIDNPYGGDVGGYENITIKGIDTRNNFDRGWILNSAGKPYNNGAGITALKNFICEDCQWYSDGVYTGGALAFGGYINEADGLDVGFIDNAIFRRIDLIGGNFSITLGNVRNCLVEDIKIIDCFRDANNHPRIVDISGSGMIQRVYGDHNYGPLVKIAPFNRTSDGTQDTFIIRNISGKNSRKYSIVEVHAAQADDAVWTGITIRSKVKVLGVTAFNTGTMTYFDGSPFIDGNPPYYTSTAIDIYGTGTDITVKDCTSINPYAMEGQVISLTNGPADTQVNNYLTAVNTLTKVNISNFIPASDSILKAAGGVDSDLPTDYYGTTRTNPPTIGAVESL